MHRNGLMYVRKLQEIQKVEKWERMKVVLQTGIKRGRFLEYVT